MITKRAFRTAFVWRNMAADREFCLGDKAMPVGAERIRHSSDFIARQQRGEH